MKLAIADPPYLGRAEMWYGERQVSTTLNVGGRIDLARKADRWEYSTKRHGSALMDRMNTSTITGYANDLGQRRYVIDGVDLSENAAWQILDRRLDGFGQADAILDSIELD